MKRRSGAPDGDDGLESLIRRHPSLDVALKRHWLRALPLLALSDRARLRQLLSSEGATSVQAPPPGAGRGSETP